MKKILILSIRKNTDASILALEQGYVKRLRGHLELRVEDIRQRYNTQEKTAVILQKEAKLFESKIPQGYARVALHEGGKSMSSADFASWLKNTQQPVVFFIGGPFGLDPSLRSTSQLALSLSTMTLTHEHARLLLLEQLYRAVDQWRDGPYHK